MEHHCKIIGKTHIELHQLNEQKNLWEFQDAKRGYCTIKGHILLGYSLTQALYMVGTCNLGSVNSWGLFCLNDAAAVRRAEAGSVSSGSKRSWEGFWDG